MSVHILGNSHVAVFKSRTGRTTRFWAEGGIIKIEDHKPKAGGGEEVSYTEIVNLRDALLRLKAINDMLGMSSQRGVEIDPQERKALEQYVEDMVAVIRRAKDQGNPYDKLKDAGIAKLSDVPVHQRHGNRVLIPQHFFLD